MENETLVKNHWAIDYKLTEHESNKEYVSFVEGTISDGLRLKANYLTENFLFEENDENERAFYKIPKYSKTFAIQEKRAFTSKTQKWLGHVIEIRKDTFIARLEELNNPDTFETVEFDIFEISPDDISLFSIGASFYWSVGYINRNSQRTKESVIKFRRLGLMSVKDIDKIEDRANTLFNSVNWGE